MRRVLAPAVVVSGLLMIVSACSSTATGNPNNGGSSSGTSGTPPSSSGSSGSTAGTGFGAQTGTGGDGTCDGACAHYLQCKNMDTPGNRSLCTQDCESYGYTPDQLANYEATDCATAIAAIDGEAPSSSGGGASGGGSDCTGCEWDGSSCIYLTGSGGNYFPCDNVCCPGH